MQRLGQGTQEGCYYKQNQNVFQTYWHDTENLVYKMVHFTCYMRKDLN